MLVKLRDQLFLLLTFSRCVSANKARDNGPMTKCPVNECSERFGSESQLYPDNFAKREINAFEVFCRGKQRDCPWKGSLGMLEAHLNECPFVDKDVQQRSPAREHSPSHVGTQLEARRSGPSYTRPQGVTETLPQEQASQEEQISARLSVRAEHEQNETDEMRRIITGLTNTVHHLERQVEEAGIRQERLSFRLFELEGLACNGSYIWKIETYRQWRQDAISGVMTAQYSPPFHTSSHGYKLCMRICLNGIDNGVGRYVALFIHMLPGDYDNILMWPFTGRIVLSILDQSGDDHIWQTLLTKPYLLSFQTPTAPLNQQGYGFVEFAPIEVIREPQYVKNNILLVKFEFYR
ncbi:TNF receptor-associated factor 6 [Desmophyllum pertusum]|uniref:TNF receptor-associated factor 6 n=1 Tax=Desmophyllum pertusum TaxID=174260 RepID=A0A9W9Z212_9CNID|nr:TNF receptor-associated factor 6 [Desmophyllum pertusum]